MYVWESEFLAEYFNGLIVIEASSVEEARQKAIGYMLEHISETKDAEYYMKYGDEDPARYIVDGWNIFMNDISKEPMVTDYVFERGSA